MDRRFSVVILLIALAGCGSPTAPAPTALTVTCASTSLNGPGIHTQCSAAATLVTGLTVDDTTTAQWKSSDATIASVAAGLVTSVAPGAVTITATVQSVSGTISITVTPIHPINRR